jgi:disulfide bond formation protein DsbB
MVNEHRKRRTVLFAAHQNDFYMRSDKYYDAAQLLLAAFVLCAVLYFQYGQNLAPCELCLWQRVPWAAIIPLATAGLMMPAIRPRSWWGYPMLHSVSAMLAVYHSGIERHWWTSGSHCTSKATPNSLEALREQILTTAPVRCDEIPWDFMGLSMTNLNAMLAATLAIGGFFLVIRKHHRR